MDKPEAAKAKLGRELPYSFQLLSVPEREEVAVSPNKKILHIVDINDLRGGTARHFLMG